MKDQKVSTILGTIILVIIAATIAAFVLICFKNYPVEDDVKTITFSERKIDTLNLQTYRNEEIGFEIKLPEGFYLEKENDEIIGEKEFVFLQKDTVDYVNKWSAEHPNIPGPSYYTDAVRLRIRDKFTNESYDKDFDGWIRKKSDISIQRTGKILIAGKDYAFVSWGSICDDYSVFISNEDYIVEFNTCASNFVVDHEPDYFSRIIETFHFSKPQENIDNVISKAGLCVDQPMGTAIGRDIYPINSKYKHLEFLGQVFTAYDCGEERLNMIDGVNNGIYSLGSVILLKNKPSKDFLNVLKSIGFQCDEDAEELGCLVWKNDESAIQVEDLMKIEPFYDSIKSDDCRHCG